MEGGLIVCTITLQQGNLCHRVCIVLMRYIITITCMWLQHLELCNDHSPRTSMIGSQIFLRKDSLIIVLIGCICYLPLYAEASPIVSTVIIIICNIVYSNKAKFNHES